MFLSDMSGVHMKRLFSTDNIRDRRGRKITVVGGDLPGSPDDASSARRISQWEPVSLAWSADGRTLYVSCRFLSTAVSSRETFAVDAATGIALVDGEGRWKAVAPVTEVDARGVLLVGAGVGVYPPLPVALSPSPTPSPTPSLTSTPTPEPTGTITVATPVPETRFTPLVLSNLAEGARQTLYLPKEPVTLPLPDYAFALNPALSGNDNRYIAFTSANKGLWILDRTIPSYRQLLERNVSHPRWNSSASALYFLESRPLSDGRNTYDLYDATFAARTGELAIPQVVMQNVDAFDIVPE